MAIKEIVGIQYGDEGKGRASHFEAKNAAIVIRSTGGSNAGHTVVANGVKYAMHLLPSSIIRPEVLSMIGPGVVADLAVLSQEIEQMRNEKIQIEKSNFVISERTHISLPHHKELDRLYELLRKEKVGTTGRGIGPTYEEKARRTNLRMIDLFLEEEELKAKIELNLKFYNILSTEINNSIKLGNIDEKEFLKITVNDEYEYCMKYKEIIQEFISDTYPIVEKAVEENKLIIIEGAQSFYLDNDHGDYPMTTSSNPNASGAISGAGIGPTLVDEVIGVIKTYTSRVGNGPFVTEQNNEIGNKIRELGHEYGTTTGRPRRIGWLDLVMIKHVKIPSGLTSLCVNHVDTIGNLDEIKVCIGYEYKGQTITNVPIDKENCKPIYKTFKGGWNTEGATTFEELPKEAKDYIKFIEQFVGVPVKYIGVGADEKNTIVKC